MRRYVGKKRVKKYLRGKALVAYKREHFGRSPAEVRRGEK